MKNFSSRTQGLIVINITAVIFGSAALYGKMDVSPFWITDMRAAFAALSLLLFGVYTKDITVLPRVLRVTMIVTGIILGIHWLAFFLAVQLAGVAVATLTFATFPLFTVLIEALHQKRKPHPAEIIAAITIIIAIGLLMNPRAGPTNLPDALAGLVSGVTFAWFGHASKQLNKTLSPVSVAFYQNIVIAAALAPSLFYVTHAPHHAKEWAGLILLGVVTTALMHQMYFYALRRLSVTTCNGFVALEPVYAILFAALFFREPVTAKVIVSAALIIGASFALLRLESLP